VAATDAAVELLIQVQHDFGEGPYLQAYAQDRAVAVEDLAAAPAWVRLNAVVGQLHVCGSPGWSAGGDPGCPQHPAAGLDCP
jgi:hypothetical protein